MPTSARRSTSANSTPAKPVSLQAERGVDVPGEENRFVYLPRGVAAIIAPWNFPLAILTGMTTAALGHRQHGGDEAGRAIAGDRRQVDGDLSRARTCRRACSIICPAGARRSARRWSSIRIRP